MALVPSKCRVELLSVDHFGHDGSEPTTSADGSTIAVGSAADGSRNADDSTALSQANSEGSKGESSINGGRSSGSSLETAARVAVANAQTFARRNPPCTEPRMGTRYWPTTLTHLSPELLAAWQLDAHAAEQKAKTGQLAEAAAGAQAASEPGSEMEKEEGKEEAGEAVSLSLPPPNPFVASDFAIRSNSASAAQATKDAALQETELLRNPKQSALDKSALSALVEALAHANSDHAASSSSSSGGSDSSGGGGSERKKCKTESGPVPGDRSGDRKKGNNAAAATKGATKPVGSLPGPPFPRPSDTPAPCVPRQRFGFDASRGSGGDGGDGGNTAEQPPSSSSPVFVELWHALDHKFALPRIECFLKLALPTAHASPAGAAAADLMVSAC